MKLLGIKPFWMISHVERSVHEGLASWWYDGEWFKPKDDPYESIFVSDFEAFGDAEAERDANSVNFIYWMHEFAEYQSERRSMKKLISAFQREISENKKI